MNDEVKEILNLMTGYVYLESKDLYGCFELNQDEAKLLLNYIEFLEKNKGYDDK